MRWPLSARQRVLGCHGPGRDFGPTMFGDADPLGQTLVLVTGTEPVVIVGIAADRNNAGLRAPPDPEVVVPLRQWGTPPSTLLVRWENEPPPTWRTLLRDVVKEADP